MESMDENKVCEIIYIYIYIYIYIFIFCYQIPGEIHKYKIIIIVMMA